VETGFREDIETKLAEAREMLEGLQSGVLHIGQPFEGRTDAKIYDLRRQIAEYQSILDRAMVRDQRAKSVPPT
jgi:hypothetical protein